MSGDDRFGMNDAPETTATTGVTMSAEEAKAHAREIDRVENPINPSTHRLIEGRMDTFVIPRDRQGQPLDEFFMNATLPADLRTAVVFQTDKGPVLAPRDPVEWDQTHDQKVQRYADQVKTQIDEHGYYSKRLDGFAKILADETGHRTAETRAMIVKQFEMKHGVDPYRYLSNVREQKGLPVRDQQRPVHRQKQGQ